ncbi:MAG: sugar transferase [Chlorobi bacterium]|nr:sugar transferase [Chlorobiota bacterium]
MNKKTQKLKYILFDYISASFAWFLFYLFRKYYIESLNYGYSVDVEFNINFFAGLFGLPIFWIMLYSISGYYRILFRKSRLIELGQTFITIIIGVVIIFFILILDDIVFSYKNYYLSVSVLFGLQFFLTYIPRLIITSVTQNKIRSGKIGFNTLLIGSNGKALNLYRQLTSGQDKYGYKFVGFINIYNKKDLTLSRYLTHLGSYNNLIDTLKKYQIEEVVIAIESSEHQEIEKILYKLQKTDVITKVIPSLFDVLTGKVRMSGFLGTPLIIISHTLMPAWQVSLKRIFDIFISVTTIIILSPVFLFAAIAVKAESDGPVFFRQKRIGLHEKPFTIIKFRSMYIDAEKNGPQLSSENDNRITKVGRFMRKTRLDEIPQFYNVLIGEMSLVGPRPERQYYIDKIIEEAPHYSNLLKVKPGITSWGQVKFGYAENLEQMIERLNYDIFYIENMSLYLDFKIMIHTILVILRRDGK